MKMIRYQAYSPLRSISKLFLLCLACYEWNAFYDMFVDEASELYSAFLPYCSSFDVQQASHACNRIASYFDVSKNTMRAVANDPNFLIMLNHDHSFESFLPTDEYWSSNQRSWMDVFSSLSIILFVSYNIKNRNSGEELILTKPNPLVAGLARVEYFNRRKEDVVQIFDNSVNLGKNAKKKLIRGEKGVSGAL
jgi:hypothetical protein